MSLLLCSHPHCHQRLYRLKPEPEFIPRGYNQDNRLLWGCSSFNEQGTGWDSVQKSAGRVQQQSHHYNRPECATPYPPSKVKLNVPIEIPQGTGCHVSPRASFIILKLMVSLYCFMAKFAVIFTIVKKSGLGGLSFQTFYHLVRILSFLYLSLSLESLSLLSLSFFVLSFVSSSFFFFLCILSPSLSFFFIYPLWSAGEIKKNKQIRKYGAPEFLLCCIKIAPANAMYCKIKTVDSFTVI